MKPTAVVVGSGPNGLSAGIVLAYAGYDVQVREAAETLGGGARSAQITLPGFVHDLGSAVHPLAVSSPLFSQLPLARHGLKWIWPPAALAHPFDDGTAITLERDLADTASQLGNDGRAYRDLFRPLVENWHTLVDTILRPVPRLTHPLLLAQFGLSAIQPATFLAQNLFRSSRAQTLFAGMAAHSALPLEDPLSSAFGLVLGGAGHAVGWPVPESGAQHIANALAGLLKSLGGCITANSRVASLEELKGHDAILCDITPRQLLRLGGERIPAGFRKALQRYRYGPGAFKVDWALREPIPWTASACLRSATVHLGGSLAEIAASERAVWRNAQTDRPFVLLAQPSLFDPTRAPFGQHTAWAYCHVPNGSPVSALAHIEAQIERFAPGFRECVLAKHVSSPQHLQRTNENLVGGDVNGGSLGVTQFLTRPTWRQYNTPLPNVFLCSSSTPPGGGVHGMCGYFAAQHAMSANRAR